MGDSIRLGNGSSLDSSVTEVVKSTIQRKRYQESWNFNNSNLELVDCRVLSHTQSAQQGKIWSIPDFNCLISRASSKFRTIRPPSNGVDRTFMSIFNSLDHVSGLRIEKSNHLIGGDSNNNFVVRTGPYTVHKVRVHLIKVSKFLMKWLRQVSFQGRKGAPWRDWQRYPDSQKKLCRACFP